MLTFQLTSPSNAMVPFWYLIGDSFTQGSCVLPGEDFASQIRILTKQSAISLGMSGNGPLIELASLKEYGLQKKPQIVLWFYFERNDLEDLRNEKSFLVKKTTADKPVNRDKVKTAAWFKI